MPKWHKVVASEENMPDWHKNWRICMPKWHKAAGSERNMPDWHRNWRICMPKWHKGAESERNMLSSLTIGNVMVSTIHYYARYRRNCTLWYQHQFKI